MTVPVPRRRDRGVSTTLSYVLTLGITTILLSGLIIATGGYVEDQRAAVVRTQAEVVAQQTAATVESADQLANYDGSVSTTRIERTFPSRIAGVDYTVLLNPNGNDRVVIEVNAEPDVRVSVPTAADLQSSLNPSAARGGNIVVVFRPSPPRLEVTEA